MYSVYNTNGNGIKIKIKYVVDQPDRVPFTSGSTSTPPPHPPTRTYRFYAPNAKCSPFIRLLRSRLILSRILIEISLKHAITTYRQHFSFQLFFYQGLHVIFV